QIVIDRTTVIPQLSNPGAVTQIEISIPIFVTELLHYFHPPAEMIVSLRGQQHGRDRGPISARAISTLCNRLGNPFHNPPHISGSLRQIARLIHELVAKWFAPK